ncbi:MAG: polysaccharide deacetylase family protein [Clostridia bacterium]|nr:polysaccharide deacetylase family protein [Clostridia bacterium]
MKIFNVLLIAALSVSLGGCGHRYIDKSGVKSVSSTAADYDTLSGDGRGWGFVKKKGAPPDILKAETELLERYNGRYLDTCGEKLLYLTFDEGYENGFTAPILDVLKRTETPAAFFVTGQYLEGQRELIQRMIDEGHIIGNHTVNHLNLPKQPVKTVQSELTGLNEKCRELYGYDMIYMRPPEGEISERVLAITNDLDMRTVMWSFAYKDWDVNVQRGADYAYSSVMPYLHPGAVILLHAVSSDNASALERIITDAIAQGYEFRSLDDLYDQE